AEARRVAVEDARTPFDLAEGGLLRATLLRLGNNRHVLLFNVHHIVSDDWSAGVIVRELVQLYEQAVSGGSLVLPPLALQYRDYAVWQQHELQGPRLAAQREYWMRQLAGEIPAIDLPTDMPRPPVKTYNGSTCSFSLSRDEAVA